MTSKNLEENIGSGAGTFKFGNTPANQLGETQYTLACIAVDTSGSVEEFKDDYERALSFAVEGCQKDHRAEFQLLRVFTFNSKTKEMHGFRPVKELNPSDYLNSTRPDGMTALYDAYDNAVESIRTYSEDLAKMDIFCNVVLFLITDGCDNSSSINYMKVAEKARKMVTQETVESFKTTVIGVNMQDSGVAKILETFSNDIKADFVKLEDASSDTLAKMGGFLSKSISSGSQALGSGGPSQSLTF